MNVFALLTGFLLALASCAPVYAGMSILPGTPAHTHSDANTGGGTLALSGTLSSTKACAAGFTRIGPNYCANDSVSSTATAWVDATACTSRTLSPAVPADASLIVLRLNWQVLSNNAIASRSNAVQFWTSATCTGATSQTFWDSVNFREFAAVAAGTTIAALWTTAYVKPAETNTVYTTQSNGGGNGNADIVGHVVLGYFD